MSESKKALKEVKILSFAQMAQGPACVQYMADMGAEVIKVERPDSGAWERSWSGLDLFLENESCFFLALNRNQRSLTVNLKTRDGKKIIYDLTKDADILVENFRPGVMKRLGLGYEKLSKINPGLIYASLTGYGSDGPYKNKPGQDLLAQALGGLASVTGKKSDLPTPAGSAVIDIHNGALSAIGILAALHYREQTGKGQKVETNLLESAIDLQIEPLTYFLNGGGKKSTERSETGIGAPFYEAPYGTYKTSDGHIAISLVPLKELGEVLDLEELKEEYSQEDAFEKRDEIKKIVQEKIKTKSTNDWLQVFEEEDIWCVKVNDYYDLVEDPQVNHNNVIQKMERADIGEFKVINNPINLSHTKPEINNPPPKLGEHTEEILESLGYSKSKIEDMKDDGIV